MNAIWYSPISDGGGAEVLFFLWAVCLMQTAARCSLRQHVRRVFSSRAGNCVSGVKGVPVLFFSFLS